MTPDIAARIVADRTSVRYAKLDTRTNTIIGHGIMGQGTALFLLQRDGNVFVLPDALAFQLGDRLDPVTMTVTPTPPPSPSE